jgi:hypothetical protein
MDAIIDSRPGFPLYQVITESLGGCVKQYPLKVIDLHTFLNELVNFGFKFEV